MFQTTVSKVGMDKGYVKHAGSFFISFFITPAKEVMFSPRVCFLVSISAGLHKN